MDIDSSISLIKNKLGQKWPFLIFRISLYIILASIMLGISWNAWGDLLKDFGIELYIPWRITEGDVLYRDIHYFQYGPLSFYWNALWFYVFGISIATIVGINLILLALLVYLLEDWLTALSDQITAMVAVLFFLAVFAFGRYVGIGNYNYLAPYAQGATHGLIATLAMLACIRRWANSDNSGWLFGAGLMVGIATLTKIEIGISALATATIYLGLTFFIKKISPGDTIKKLVIFLAAFILPPLITVLLFSLAMTPEEAISGVFNQWLAVWDGRISETGKSYFYVHSTGMDDISGNLLKLGKWSWIYFNFTLTGLFLSLVLSKIKNKRLLTSFVVTGCAFAVLYFLVPFSDWFDIFRPLPLVMALGFLFLSWLTISDKTSIFKKDYPLYLASLVFAGTFLLKLGLVARIHNYGFVLAMPATLLTVVILLKWLPKYFEHFNLGFVFKSLVIGLLIAGGGKYIEASYSHYSHNEYTCCSVNNGIDAINTNRFQGAIVGNTIEELDKRLKPGQTFVVVPEGIMFNYILRRRNPTQYIHFVPSILINNSEKDIIDSFAKNIPDYVIFVHMDTSEFGYKFFGKDYAKDLYTWINKNYHTVWQEGDTPLQSETDFGISIAERVNKSK